MAVFDNVKLYNRGTVANCKVHYATLQDLINYALSNNISPNNIRVEASCDHAMGSYIEPEMCIELSWKNPQS